MTARLDAERAAVPPDREMLITSLAELGTELLDAEWDAVELINDTIAALRSPADGWRSIESAPKDGTIILLAWGGRTRPAHWRQAWLPDDGGAIEITKPGPSLWMPLPFPPAEEKTP